MLKLNDREGMKVSVMDEILLLSSKEEYAIRFLIEAEGGQFFAIFELGGGIFLIHAIDKAYVIKDSKVFIKTLLFSIISKIERKLSERFGEVYYLEKVREPGFLVFGGEVNEYVKDREEVLSAIEVDGETFPIKIIRKGKIVSVLVHAENFAELFLKKLKENYKIKE